MASFAGAMSSASSLGSATVRVEKATSDLLIGPDWTLNMDICDSINSDHWQAKDVVKAVKKRLQHKNPKVQFLSLTLLETMIKNCGDYVHHQVVERDILQEMIKIVRKKTDMQVRNKILVLLDSWQEAFGGPGGKYPQYYWAYAELKRSGVVFPQRSADSALIFAQPGAHPTSIPRHPQANYGMPNNASVRLDEAMASEMANMSLSDLDSIQRVMELLSEMLRAVSPSDRGAVKDEVIVDLVSQCRSNQKRLMQLVNSTGDEELLGQGLPLNDSLQSVLAKHDAIASGSPLPNEASEPLPEPSSTPVASASVVDSNKYVDEEEEDDEFAQLARRNSKLGPATAKNMHPAAGDHKGSENNSDITNFSTSTATEASSAVASNALALPDPPAPVRTSKEQDMIDFLSITLSSNPSPPHTPLTPSAAFNQSGSPLSAANGQAYPYNPQAYAENQGYNNPYNSYVAPWARAVPSHSQPQPSTAPPPPQQPQPQVPQYPPPQQPQPQVSQYPPPQQPQPQVSQYPPPQQPQPQVPQPQVPQYPPPPWAGPVGSNPNPFLSSGYQVPATPATTASYVPATTASYSPASTASYVPLQPPKQLQYNSSSGSRVNNAPVSTGEFVRVNPTANQRLAGPGNSAKPYVPPYRLFEDLIELRNPDGSLKVGGAQSSLSGTSNQGMIGGRK